MLVKTYAMGIAQGVTCINWFEGRDGDSGPMGLLDRAGKQRPSYTAMGTMIQQLGSNPKFLGWVLLHNKHYGFVFEGTKAKVLVAWAARGVTDKINFGQGRGVRRSAHRECDQRESLELTERRCWSSEYPEKLLAEAKANKGRPFPVGRGLHQC